MDVQVSMMCVPPGKIPKQSWIKFRNIINKEGGEWVLFDPFGRARSPSSSADCPAQHRCQQIQRNRMKGRSPKFESLCFRGAFEGFNASHFVDGLTYTVEIRSSYRILEVVLAIDETSQD